jgi:hypothetical protein
MIFFKADETQSQDDKEEKYEPGEESQSLFGKVQKILILSYA